MSRGIIMFRTKAIKWIAVLAVTVTAISGCTSSGSSALLSPSTLDEPSSMPVQPQLALVDGTEKKLQKYLNDNFEGTDWLLWVDSSRYYLEGPVRVIDLYLNSFVSTDQESAKSIAQTACIAIFTFWIDQDREGERSFEVLFVGDGAGNVYRREDYANGERCQGD